MHKNINVLKYMVLTLVLCVFIGWTSNVQAEERVCTYRYDFGNDTTVYADDGVRVAIFKASGILEFEVKTLSDGVSLNTTGYITKHPSFITTAWGKSTTIDIEGVMTNKSFKIDNKECPNLNLEIGTSTGTKTKVRFIFTDKKADVGGATSTVVELQNVSAKICDESDKTNFENSQQSKFQNLIDEYESSTYKSSIINSPFPIDKSGDSDFAAKINSYVNLFNRGLNDDAIDFFEKYQEEYIGYAKDCANWNKLVESKLEYYNEQINNVKSEVANIASSKIEQLINKRKDEGADTSDLEKILAKMTINRDKENEKFDDDIDNAISNINSSLDFGKDVPTTCEGILSDVMPLIKKVYGWVQILAPILLIVFGSLDYSKAIITDDQDGLKKANSNFVKRLIATVIIFFVPTILNIIFSLLKDAGIEITTCGISMIIGVMK